MRLPTARSEEHTSELQSLCVISYAVFCLKKKNTTTACLTGGVTFDQVLHWWQAQGANMCVFFFNGTATPEIYTPHNTLSLHDALPIYLARPALQSAGGRGPAGECADRPARSEEHTSELQSLCVISYAVFCLKKKKKKNPYLHTILLHTKKKTKNN